MSADLPDGNEEEPQQAVDALFLRLSRMSELDLRRVRLAWEVEDADRRSRIWRRAKPLIQEGDRDRLLEQSRDRLAAWANDFASGRTGTPEDASWDMGRLDARTAAIPAVLDAVLAVVAGEGLAVADRSFLSAPFRSGFLQPTSRRPRRRTAPRSKRPKETG